MKPLDSLTLAMAGDVGWYFGNSPLSRAIRTFERIGDGNSSPPSHVFIVLDQTRILEVLMTGVRITPASRYADDSVRLFRPPGSPDAKSDALETIFRRFRRARYGYLQALAFSAVLIARRLGFRLINLFRHGVICSELGLEYLRELCVICALRGERPASAWLRWSLGIDPNQCDPDLLLSFFEGRILKV